MAQLRRTRVLLLAGLGLLSTVVAGRADWLVRKDGGRIETRGASLIKDGMVAYFDQAGQVKTFPIEELDQNATKLANLVARRQPRDQHVVVDESQVVPGDAEITAALQEYEEAPSPGAREAALRKMNATLERVGGPEVKYRRCGEMFADWMEQTMCRLGAQRTWSNSQRTVVYPSGPGALRDAVRTFQCQRRYPRNAAGFQACRSGRD